MAGPATDGGDDLTEEAAIVRFLESPAAHGGETPQHVETHLSHLFLAGDRVLKLKKRIAWAVVDYSSLDKREGFCRRELEVNRRFAPDLYVGVVPVTRGPDGLALGGEGDVVEWLVEMRRFAADEQLDVMADRGTLTPEIIDATADGIAAMHRTAPVVHVAGADPVAARSDQLHRDVAAGLKPGPVLDDVEAWYAAARSVAAEHRGLLDRRGRHGFTRRCHGDLHLSNICLWDGRPTPFDAIEFSEDIATIDVLYDLAFVLVDLDSRQREALSWRLLSRYLEATRDYCGLAVMPLFLSQRAMVRALTRLAKGQDAAPSAAMARHYLERPAAARLIAVGGLSGSGKSTVARALAPVAGAVVVRSDTVRKRLAGVAPEERLGAGSYTAEANRAVYRRMMVEAGRALRAGATVILDATFADATMRGLARGLAEERGVPFAGVWLSAPARTLHRRVEARTGDASDADVAVVDAQLSRPLGPLDWDEVDADGGIEDVVARAGAALGLPAPCQQS
ncbi:bifunctional aminoglycoside phosphotransferase/ATP-binding protein [Acuticoccus sediminis]|uniref:bifunctional aminoglycoside phosphotransferase/ATP-binding protein n=1 Tax=Acuticoccus sediminis TaxID=2184697 RepID=UPI001CFD3312|nr:bifunctional aminoglycoside phosphotransferase/ATP-binding protein [Acuticoccus sediminis]